jgi:hypothetical protein
MSPWEIAFLAVSLSAFLIFGAAVAYAAHVTSRIDKR